MKDSNEKKLLMGKISFIVGIVLCAILLPLLIMNITMIIKSYTNEDEVPSVGKYVPFIVLTDSMSGKIESGDFIICKKIDASDVEKGMIITFYDPAGNGTTVVTHEVIDIRDNNGLEFQTKGCNNNAPDDLWVPAENVIAEYKFRLPLLGHVSLFMSTVPGLIVCVLVPLGLLVGYDVIKRRIREKENKQDTDALLAELNALRALQNKTEGNKEEEVTEEVTDDKNE